MRALVTGGAGFIGSHVARQLAHRGDRVRVLHLASDDTRNLDDLDVERVIGDVTDHESVASALDGIDVVFHLAAIYALWTRSPDRLWDVNVGGTRTVLSAARERGLRVVYTSSIAVFGGQGAGRDATEQSAFRLGSTGDLYAFSKFAAHQVALREAAAGGDITIVAPTGPLGPGDVGPTPTGRLLLAAVNLPVTVTTRTASSFIDVRDCATGHLLALEKGKAGRSYLLGDWNVTAAELARRVQHLTGRRRPVVLVPHAIASVAGLAARTWADRVSGRAPPITPAAIRISRLGLRADPTRARRELGLPSRDLDETLRDALTWFRDAGYA